MKLTHIGISFFRSIGEQPVTINLNKKINVLVGANNCGKSNVLRALSGFDTETVIEIDQHKRDKENSPIYWLTGQPTMPEEGALSSISEILIGRQLSGSEAKLHTKLFLGMDWSAFQPIWAQFVSAYHYNSWPTDSQVEGEKNSVRNTIWSRLKKVFPKTALVPQFRQITESSDYSVEGKGIVKILAKWQNPKIGEEQNRDKFLKIQSLLRSLIQLPEVNLEVDHEAKNILVSNGTLRLPLDSYGTGIHQLIILSIAVLGHENTLVCVEEPEIHLHPLLQRRFLDFLRKETTNRYVITTHSHALIAIHPDTAVIHLGLENGATKSRLIETTSHSLDVLRDLGARASDILQANSVIWVEGPSDRIYINRWLTLLYPDRFREGIDYSIMFYGGRLLSHVSLNREDEEEAADLVRLLNINQYSAILIDSDRRNSSAPLNPTKERVKTECKKSDVLCWITDGREIENYLPAAVVAATYSELANVNPEIKLKKFEALEDSLHKAFGKQWKRANYYSEAKPQMARKLVEKLTAESISPELKSWIEKLAKVIAHD